MEELFPLVNEQGDLIGKASRALCHSGSFLLHPVVHLHVFNLEGQLYLQKRSLSKDIQPGMWDTSVGGHVDYAETIGNADWIRPALNREASEELKLIFFEPVFVTRYVFRSSYECELVHTYFTIYEGTPQPDPEEISEGRFWEITEILSLLGKGVFTPNFEGEIEKVLEAFKSR